MKRKYFLDLQVKILECDYEEVLETLTRIFPAKIRLIVKLMEETACTNHDFLEYISRYSLMWLYEEAKNLESFKTANDENIEPYLKSPKKWTEDAIEYFFRFYYYFKKTRLE